jgi:hypothetical protein
MEGEWAAERKRLEQPYREGAEDENCPIRGDQAADRDQGHRQNGERHALRPSVREHHAETGIRYS